MFFFFFFLVCFCTLVQLGNDGDADFIQHFLLIHKCLVFCNMILIEPVDDFIVLVKHLLFVLIIDSAFDIFYLQPWLSCWSVRFKRIVRRYLCLSAFHFNFVVLSVLNCTFSVFLAQRKVSFVMEILLFFSVLLSQTIIWDILWKTVVCLWIKTCQAGCYGTFTFIN